MNAPTVLALGVVDAERIVGSSGLHHTFASLGVRAPGDGRTFKAVTGRSDETFRRIDPVSRALVLAAEAAGLADVLPREHAAAAGLVFETEVGCLESDLKFAHSIAAGMCDGPVFPYTLPSTCLGELALRHGLRGPTVCVSTTRAQRGIALHEAQLLLATGECAFVVAGCVDVLLREKATVEPVCQALVAVLAAKSLGLRGVAEWIDGPGAYERWAASFGAV